MKIKKWIQHAENQKVNGEVNEYLRRTMGCDNVTFTWSRPGEVAGDTKARAKARQSCQSVLSDP
jgi:hypothetical protein